MRMLVISNLKNGKRNSHCTELSDFKFGVVMVFEYQNNLYLQCHWLCYLWHSSFSSTKRKIHVSWLQNSDTRELLMHTAKGRVVGIFQEPRCTLKCIHVTSKFFHVFLSLFSSHLSFPQRVYIAVSNAILSKRRKNYKLLLCLFFSLLKYSL